MKSHHYSRHAGPLKQALRRAIPPAELKALHAREPALHFAVLAWQVLLLGTCTALLLRDLPAWAAVPLVVVQGFTIFNFTVLLHEVVHNLVFRRPQGRAERFLAWLYAVPSGLSATQFTRWHLDHHQELGSATDDPKRFHLSPKRNARWVKALYVTPALFFIYFGAAAREMASYPADVQRRIRFERRVTLVVHLAILGALASFDPWSAVRVHAAPVFLVFPVAFTLNRIGQHYAIDPSRPAEWSTLVKDQWFWNVAFLNSNFHLEHHYFPGVPLYRLRALHLRLADFYRAEGMVAKGYGELLWGWFVRNEPPHAAWGSPAPHALPAATR